MDFSKTTEIFGKCINIKFNDCISNGEQQSFHERALTLYIHINKICIFWITKIISSCNIKITFY